MSERKRATPQSSRREFLAWSASLAVAAGASGCKTDESALNYPFGPRGEDVDDSLLPTPSCTDGDEPSNDAVEGPFYTPDTPMRTSFLADAQGGVELLLLGRVLSTSCAPIAGAVIDFWHCDENGDYDNVGFLFRGHQYTDDKGVFQLRTIKPPIYQDGTFRSPHIHVKLQGPGTEVLTTQLFFAEDAADHERDSVYEDGLIVTELGEDSGVRAVLFDFVLAPATGGA